MTGRQAQAERRFVTVLFADVAGFSSLAETLNAESLRELLNSVFELLVPTVERYGGTVDKFMGDCLMALFGAPVSHDDDAERAVRAALEMRHAVEAFDIETRFGLAIHIGINTGQVVAGSVGGGGRTDYSVVGDDVNVARRLQEAAEPSEILIGPRTMALAGRRFVTEQAVTVSVRGRRDPVAAYSVVALKAGPDDCHEPWTAGLLVGREKELEVLRQLLDRLASGEGGVFLLRGEAGLGKSRLLWEARRYSEDRGLNWLEGRALSFGQGLPYYPFKEILEQDAAIVPPDGQELRYHKLAARLEELTGDGNSAYLPHLAGVVGLELPQPISEELRHSPDEERRRLLFESVAGHLAALARVRPLVVVLEDAHWLHDSSVALVKHLLPLVEEVPLLLCLPFRDGGASPPARLLQDPRNSQVSRTTSIQLSRLDRRQTAELARCLMGLEALPLSLEKNIASRTGGNPLFVEELVRHLTPTDSPRIDSAALDGVVRRAADRQVPDTLQGVINARIDYLPPEAKDLLRQASVIGPEFSRNMLFAFAEGHFTDVEGALSQLMNRGFLREHRDDGQLYLSFKHALVQEAAYEGILVRDRKELHLGLARAVEALYPDRTEELCGLLAYHYTQAEDWDNAHAYLMNAGARAVMVSADVEALWHYQQALSAILRSFDGSWGLPDEDPAQWLFSRTDPFWLVWQLGTLVESLEDFYQRTLEAYGQSDGRTAAAACVLAAAYIQGSQCDEAAALLEQIDVCVRPRSPAPSPLLTRLDMLLGTARRYQRRYPEAESLLLRALAGEQSASGRAGVLASIYTHLTSTYFFLGAPDRCLQVCEAAVGLPEVQKSPFFWLILLNLSSSHLDAGRAEEAVAIARRCLQGTHNPHARAFAHSHLAEALQALGRFDEAGKHYKSSIDQLERLGLYRDSPGILAQMAEMQLQADRLDLAETLAQDALRRMEEFAADKWLKPCAFLTLAGVALARNDLEAADDMLELSRSSAESNLPAVGSFSAELHQRTAELRYRQGKTDQARASLKAAAGIWTRLGGAQHPRLRVVLETWQGRGLLEDLQLAAPGSHQ